jgi:hypothetical protein
MQQVQFENLLNKNSELSNQLKKQREIIVEEIN